MTNDSVREELIVKVSARLKPLFAESSQTPTAATLTTPTPPPNIPSPIAAAKSPAPVAPVAPIVETPKSVTTELAAKPTSPTLVEFHSKNATVPEWRLQLQNAVRQRQGQTTMHETASAKTAAPRATLVTSGANALKTEVVEIPQTHSPKNSDLARALERIENSRRKFLAAEEIPTAPPAPKNGKNYPFHIAPKTVETNVRMAEANPPVVSFPKPKLAASPELKKEKLDTNKLPPLSEQIAANFAAPSVTSESISPTMTAASQTPTMSGEHVIEPAVVEEYDDCPTFGMRFNAGLFDLIIGSFASFCLLAPFMLMGGEWFSGAGLFAFVTTVAIVMFVYLTMAIGFYGRTFGMRLFSLELVDIEGEEYPTFHQAAVSSSVYLLSLAVGGLGFLTVFFNDDKRAAHDLVSKTIIVKE